MGLDVQDIEEIVRDWAWDMYDTTDKSKAQKNPHDGLDMTVSWKNVRFEHGEPEFTEKEQTPQPKSQVQLTSDLNPFY